VPGQVLFFFPQSPMRTTVWRYPHGNGSVGFFFFSWLPWMGRKLGSVSGQVFKQVFQDGRTGCSVRACWNVFQTVVRNHTFWVPIALARDQDRSLPRDGSQGGPVLQGGRNNTLGFMRPTDTAGTERRPRVRDCKSPQETRSSGIRPCLWLEVGEFQLSSCCSPCRAILCNEARTCSKMLRVTL
jgi:hypothetical protein